MTFINFLMSAIAVGANLISNINSNQNNNNNNNNDNNDNVANFNFVNNNNGGNNQNTIQICKYIAPNNFTRVLGTYRAYNMIYQLEIYSTFYLMLVHTSWNSFYKWTKISSLEITIFYLKMMVKSGLDFLF